MNKLSNWQKQNNEAWQTLDFVLKGRTTSVVIWISCNDYRHLRTVFAQFKNRYREAHHLELNIGEFDSGTIPAYITSLMPNILDNGNAPSQILHLFGVEKHIEIGSGGAKTKFFQALNFERELLFQSFPFPIIFWSEEYSQIKAQQLAPDFWDWLSYKIHFESPQPPSGPFKEGFISGHEPTAPGVEKEAIYHRIARNQHELEKLDATTQRGKRERSSILSSLAIDYFSLQEFKKSLHCHELLLKDDGFLSLRDKGWTLNQMGQIQQILGNLDKALEAFENSLEIVREIGDLQGEGSILNNISQIYKGKGYYNQALKFLGQSLTLRHDIGDRQGEGITLNNISQIYYAMGDYDQAVEFLRQSLKIQQDDGNLQGEGPTLNNISQIYKSKGDYKQALEYLNRSLKIMQYIGDRQGEGVTLNNIGQIYGTKEDYGQALEYLRKSLKISQDIGDVAGQANTMVNIGAALFEQNQIEAAVEYLEQAHQIFERTGSPNREIAERWLQNVIDTIGEARYQAILQGMNEEK